MIKVAEVAADKSGIVMDSVYRPSGGSDVHGKLSWTGSRGKGGAGIQKQRCACAWRLIFTRMLSIMIISRGRCAWREKSMTHGQCTASVQIR